MSDATQSQTIEQTLNKTDLGHTIYENRKLFVGIVLVILIGVTGFFAWKQMKKSSAHDSALVVFEFQNGPWAEAKAGKLNGAGLVQAFSALEEDARSSAMVLPIALEMSKFLYDKGEFNEANDILSNVGKMNHPMASFFLNMQKAVTLEKVGKIDEAIGTLETLLSTKESLMGGKVAVELGRLYLVKGEKGKAQTQFDYVVSTYPNDETAKIAKLYLAQIAK